MPDLARRFPRYTDFDPLVPVWCVTPGKGRTIHRFFDSSPFSPSGRYMALFRLPQEDRDRAGEVIFRFVFRSLYRFGAFNGDPHPGNYLFHEDGTVTFLDFGLVKPFMDPRT